MKSSRHLWFPVLALLALGLSAGPIIAASTAAAPSSSGYRAAHLFNVGNAYAREGKSGLAVLNYERARLLAPVDPDMRANLHYVQTAAGLPPTGDSRLDDYVRFISPNTGFWLGCFGIALLGAGVLVGRRYRVHRSKLRLVSATGLALMALSLANAAATWPMLREAVVTAHSAQAYVAPVNDATTAFTLPEAEIVTMKAQRDNYVLVRTHSGHVGWVSGTDLTSVVPRGGQST